MKFFVSRLNALAYVSALCMGVTGAQAIAQQDSKPGVMACRVIDQELQVSYTGGCANGLANGRGIARGTNGVYYDGGFLAGLKSGEGTKLYSNGDAYTGGWVADAREGQGTYIFGENSPWRGDRSHGQWVGDKRHGDGVYIFAPDGVRMETQFFAGAPIGYAPPSIVQRQRALKALAPVIGKPGAKVCSVSTQGASPKRIAYGVVTQVLDDRLQVRIDTDSVIDASESKTNPRWDSLTDWMPC